MLPSRVEGRKDVLASYLERRRVLVGRGYDGALNDRVLLSKGGESLK